MLLQRLCRPSATALTMEGTRVRNSEPNLRQLHPKNPPLESSYSQVPLVFFHFATAWCVPPLIGAVWFLSFIQHMSYSLLSPDSRASVSPRRKSQGRGGGAGSRGYHTPRRARRFHLRSHRGPCPPASPWRGAFACRRCLRPRAPPRWCRHASPQSAPARARPIAPLRRARRADAVAPGSRSR